MEKLNNMKKIIVISIIIFFLIGIFPAGKVLGDDPFIEVKEKMSNISDEEKKIVEELFILLQDIEEMEREVEKISKEIEKINDELRELEEKIKLEEIAYKKNRDTLRDVLKIYQKRGTGSFIEIILSSQNLTTFIRRLNALRDLTRNTGELLTTLDESKERLSTQKEELDNKLNLVKTEEEKLKIALYKKLAIRKDMEDFLDSLLEERELYEEYLLTLEKGWDVLKILFNDSIKEFSRMIEEGNIPADAIDITFSLPNIKGTMSEEDFNNIILSNPNLPEMVFVFEEEKVTLNMPSENLSLSGNFIILDDQSIKFQVSEGNFYDMKLEKASIEELFKDGELVLNLKPILDKNIIKSIEVKEDYIELSIGLKLF